MIEPKGKERVDSFFRNNLGVDLTKETLDAMLSAIGSILSRLFYGSENRARRNGRNVILLQDLCITEALEEAMKRYDAVRDDLRVAELLEYISFVPPEGHEFGDAEELERVLGGLLLVFGDLLKMVSPSPKPTLTEVDKVRSILETVF